MAVITRQSAEGQEVIITLSERFDFTLHKEFRQAYESVKSPRARYIVDLHDTVYMDSSALGMLLLLREYAGGDTADIRIVHCHPSIRTILTIANFHQLFTIV